MILEQCYIYFVRVITVTVIILINVIIAGEFVYGVVVVRYNLYYGSVVNDESSFIDQEN